MDLTWLNVRRLPSTRENRKNHQVQAKILFTVLVKGSTMCVKRCLQKTLEKTDEAQAKPLVRLIPDSKSTHRCGLVVCWNHSLLSGRSRKYRCSKLPCYTHSWVTAGARGALHPQPLEYERDDVICCFPIEFPEMFASACGACSVPQSWLKTGL